MRGPGKAGEIHESTGIGEKDVPQLQGHSQEGRGARHLHQPAAQTATGLMIWHKR
jgi:hypothetical protein